MSKPPITVWSIEPGSYSEEEARESFLHLLDESELIRYGRYVRDSHRHLYLCAHAMLRKALSAHVDRPPESWRFEANNFGRPELIDNVGSLRFSLSHTEGLAVCAVTEQVDVGIDVERVGRIDDIMPFAKRYFSNDECEQLVSLNPDQMQCRFTRLWTLKEAYAKGLGKGMYHPFDQINFDFRSDEDQAVCTEGPDYKDWQFLTNSPSQSLRISVAAKTRRQDRTVQFHSIESIP